MLCNPINTCHHSTLLRVTQFLFPNLDCPANSGEKSRKGILIQDTLYLASCTGTSPWPKTSDTTSVHANSSFGRQLHLALGSSRCLAQWSLHSLIVSWTSFAALLMISSSKGPALCSSAWIIQRFPYCPYGCCYCF